jgi:hypothetical protein
MTSILVPLVLLLSGAAPERKGVALMNAGKVCESEKTAPNVITCTFTIGDYFRFTITGVGEDFGGGLKLIHLRRSGRSTAWGS